MAVVCVDAGTTMIKAVGYGDGRRRARGRRQAADRRAPARARAGRSRTWPQVWEAVVRAVREVVAAAARRRVDFVAITAQGDGCWLVDGDGAADRARRSCGTTAGPPTIVDEWDARRRRSTEAFRDQRLAGVRRACPTPILTWLREHDPDRLERSAPSLTCGGWIFARMTGRARHRRVRRARRRSWTSARARVVRPSCSSCTTWSGRGGCCPSCAATTGAAAPLTAAAAARARAARGHARGAGARTTSPPPRIGVGAVAPGQACSILGTTLCTEVVADEPRLDGDPAGLTVALGVPGATCGRSRRWPAARSSSGRAACWAWRRPGRARRAGRRGRARRGRAGLPAVPLAGRGAGAVPRPAGARARSSGCRSSTAASTSPARSLEGLTLVIRDCLAASGPRRPSCGSAAAARPARTGCG